MVQEKEVYISIRPEEYKHNRSQLLNTQMDILDALKHLEKLKLIRKQQNIFKQKVHLCFEKIIFEIEGLEKILPNSHIPKIVKTHKIKESILKEDKKTTKEERIEQELLDIQEKLKILNGQ